MTYPSPEFISPPHLAFGNTGFSPEARTIYDTIAKILDWIENSQALFGEKAKAIWQLSDLADECAAQNWDGYDARPIDIEAVKIAERFVRVLPPDAPLPEFAAEPDGSISMDWAPSQNRIFSISIDSSDRLACAWVDGPDKGHAVIYFDGYTIPPRVLEEIEAVTGR